MRPDRRWAYACPCRTPLLSRRLTQSQKVARSADQSSLLSRAGSSLRLMHSVGRDLLMLERNCVAGERQGDGACREGLKGCSLALLLFSLVGPSLVYSLQDLPRALTTGVSWLLVQAVGLSSSGLSLCGDWGSVMCLPQILSAILPSPSSSSLSKLALMLQILRVRSSLASSSLYFRRSWFSLPTIFKITPFFSFSLSLRSAAYDYSSLFLPISRSRSLSNDAMLRKGRVSSLGGSCIVSFSLLIRDLGLLPRSCGSLGRGREASGLSSARKSRYLRISVSTEELTARGMVRESSLSGRTYVFPCSFPTRASSFACFPRCYEPILRKARRCCMETSSLEWGFLLPGEDPCSPGGLSRALGRSLSAWRLMLTTVGRFMLLEEIIIFYQQKGQSPVGNIMDNNQGRGRVCGFLCMSDRCQCCWRVYIIGRIVMQVNRGLLKREPKAEPPPIVQFHGYYQFLSIDYPCWVYYQGFLFPSAATAFQAARATDATLRRRISQVKDQEQLRKIMSEIKNPSDWPQRRVAVMEQLNRDKFKRNRDLGLKLFATQSRTLVNGYPHGGEAEAFWGAVNKKGQLQGLNTLGVILTTIRQEIHAGVDSAKWIDYQNIEKEEALWPQANLVAESEDGSVDSFPLQKKGRWLLGWGEGCEVKLQQKVCSKFHAGIYFSADMQAVLVDLNSSQGTRIIRAGQESKLEPLRPESLQNEDIIFLGHSKTKYIIYISYEEVQARIAQQKQQAAAELSRIQKIKSLQAQATLNQQRAQQQRSSIRSLLQLKKFSCLYVQNVNRNFSYKDIRELFNQYGRTKNIRINIDRGSGRFMGSVLVYFDEGVRINEVMQGIRDNPIKYEFRVVAVSAEEAEKIIATFSNKESQQKITPGEAAPQQNTGNRQKKKPESPRRRADSRSSSSNSSSSFSSSRSRSRQRRHDRSHRK